MLTELNPFRLLDNGSWHGEGRHDYPKSDADTET